MLPAARYHPVLQALYTIAMIVYLCGNRLCVVVHHPEHNPDDWTPHFRGISKRPWKYIDIPTATNGSKNS